MGIDTLSSSVGAQPDRAEPLFETLGTWMAGVTLDRIPDVVTNTAKRGIIDLLGVTMAAVDTPLAQVVARFLDDEGPGPATVIGLGRSASGSAAAQANGAIGHALDFDDVSHTLGGHPSVVIVPAVLAGAEMSSASGADLLLGYVVGEELETRIAHAVNFVHYDKGWHPTATLGVFGAAAAAAKVFGLDAEGCITALGLASAFSAGIKSSFGTTAKPLQVGRASQSGLTAALLARVGATANGGAFEHKQGFGNVFNGTGLFNPAKATTDLTASWDLEEPGLSLKRHPCCGGTHAAVDCALALREEIGGPERIRKVAVSVHPARFAHLDRPTVGADALEAKFSLQYSVALALRHGHVAIAHFTDEALADPEVQSLVAATDASSLPPDRTGPERFAAEMTLTLDDGTEHHLRLERPVGRTPETRLSDQQVEDKFRRCAEGLLSGAELDELAHVVWRLEDQPDVVRLGELLIGGDRA